jgi:dephospho-CoA kinase
MALVIGLVGEIGSGKGTSADMLAGFAREAGKSFIKMRFSDVLRETLTLWRLPHTRENLQALPTVMNRTFGEGTLTQAVKKRIEDAREDIIVLDGVRWGTDAELIRSCPAHLLLYITAEADLRFERTKERGENFKESDMTFEKFREAEQARTEIEIATIGASADVCIKNDGAKEKFAKALRTVWEQRIAPRLL